MVSMSKIAAACALFGAGQAIYLNPGDVKSVKAVAAQIAGDTMRQFYINAPIQGIGQLPKPYYWWEAGATFGSLVNYWAITNDNSLNDIVGYAILSQLSPTTDFMMPDQHYDLGNDDQVIWGLTAMEAAEHNFPIPSANISLFSNDIWLTAAKNVWTDISKRWDTSTCNGGVRWQIYSSNSGYTYKSAISNAGLFQLSARLARYTGDSDGSYQKMAEQVYDWMTSVNIVKDYGSQGTMVFDGATTTSNCADVDLHRWTYNAGAMYLGAQVLASLGGSNAAKWGPIASGLFTGIQSAFLGQTNTPNVFYELNCEPFGTCNTDQKAFKALMIRWLNKVPLVSNAPYTNALIAQYNKNSALAAAGTCSGGSSGTLCGEKWVDFFGFDGDSGVGQQISALEAVQGIISNQTKLATAKTASSSSGLLGRDLESSAKFTKRELTARDYMEMGM